MSRLIYVAVILFGVFAGCKKGEDDPLISLQSRKSRIEGKWRLQKGKITVDFMNATSGYHFDGVYTLDGSKLEGVETTLTTITNVSGVYLIDLTVDKKGRFSFRENQPAIVIEAEGTWDFSNGSGEEKGKESIIMQIDHVTSGKTSAHFFNQAGLTFKYKIRELRSKTLVLTSSATMYVDTKGQTQKIAAEYTFIQ